MRTFSFIFLSILLSTLTASATAMTRLGRCIGHYFMRGSDYPYSEDIITDQQVIGNTWTKVATGCMTAQSDGGSPVTIGNANLDARVDANILLRAHVNLQSGTPGVRYEIKFAEGPEGPGQIVYGWYVRQVLNEKFPQGDNFFSTVQNISHGTHSIGLWLRVIDYGQTITFGNRWMSLQGAPSDGVTTGTARFPSRNQVNPDTYYITGGWTSGITPNLTFTNTEPVDMFVHAYFEINAGNVGDLISVGFQLDTESPSRRTSTVEVISPSGYPLRYGVNIADHLENVAANVPHVLKLNVINRNGNITTVSNRQIEFVSLPAGSQNPLIQMANPGPTTVNSSAPSGETIYSPKQDICGYWYKVGDFGLPMPTPQGEHNWVGEAYVELTGRTGGTWSDGNAELAVEVYENPGLATDMGWSSITVPAGHGHVYWPIEAFLWGDAPNYVRIWARKASPPCGSDGQFSVGKVYAAIKLTPTDNATDYLESCRCGDVNADRSVDATDVQYLTEFVYSPQLHGLKCNGDLNGDGAINQADIDLLNRYIGDNRTPLNCPQY